MRSVALRRRAASTLRVLASASTAVAQLPEWRYADTFFRPGVAFPPPAQPQQSQQGAAQPNTPTGGRSVIGDDGVVVRCLADAGRVVAVMAAMAAQGGEFTAVAVARRAAIAESAGHAGVVVSAAPAAAASPAPPPVAWLDGEMRLAAARAAWLAPASSAAGGSVLDVMVGTLAVAPPPAARAVTGVVAVDERVSVAADALFRARHAAARALPMCTAAGTAALMMAPRDADAGAASPAAAVAQLSGVAACVQSAHATLRQAPAERPGGGGGSAAASPTPEAVIAAVGASLIQETRGAVAAVRAAMEHGDASGTRGGDAALAAGDVVRLGAACETSAALTAAALHRHIAGAALLTAAAGVHATATPRAQTLLPLLALAHEHAQAYATGVQRAATAWRQLVWDGATPQPLHTLLQGVAADVLRAAAHATAMKAEMDVLTALASLFLQPPQSRGPARAGALFPLSNEEQKAVEPVLGRASQGTQGALRLHDAMAAQVSGGPLTVPSGLVVEAGPWPLPQGRAPLLPAAAVWADGGRHWSHPATQPLRTLAVLQFASQRAVMADGLLQGALSHCEAVTWRVGDGVTAKPRPEGASTTLGDRFAAAPLPLLAEVAHLAGLQGALFAQWEKREAAGERLLLESARMQRAVLHRLGLLPSAQASHMAPPQSTPRASFVQLQILGAAMAATTGLVGSIGVALPSNLVSVLS